MPIHLGSVWAYARGTFTTNIPLSLFLAIAWRNSLGRLQPVAAFDIGNRALSAGTLPDGTSIQIIDADRWDQIAANTFEDDLLRKEALPIAIYNTTARPALGNRVARILGHLGAHVVSVGNDEVIPERCIVAASKKLETSSTVRVIQSVLDCEYRTLEGQERADVVVRLGIGYE
jgi:hypothetical protein